MNSYKLLKEFKKKYPGAVTWFRLKRHCQIIDKHLNPNENILCIFAGQLDNDNLSFFNTGVVAVTNQRLLVAQNRLIIGYKFVSVTPDLYNDFTVNKGFIWGTVIIDTAKEKIFVSNLAPASLPEIETAVTTNMQAAKRAYLKKQM